MGRPLDPDSPFANHTSTHAIKPNLEMFVNFCTVCHYVWKAPAPTAQCINCTNEGTAICLITYRSEVPVT